jgi:hypothetical protein
MAAFTRGMSDAAPDDEPDDDPDADPDAVPDDAPEGELVDPVVSDEGVAPAVETRLSPPPPPPQAASRVQKSAEMAAVCERRRRVSIGCFMLDVQAVLAMVLALCANWAD